MFDFHHLLQRAFDHLDFTGADWRFMAAAWAARGGAVNVETFLALAHSHFGLFGAGPLFPILQRPLAHVIGQAVLDRVARMVKDDGFGLAFGFALYGFLNLSLAWGMSAGLSSLVLQTQAFFTMGLAFLLLGERPSRFQVGGALVAFAGIGVIALERMAATALVPLGMTLLGLMTPAWLRR